MFIKNTKASALRGLALAGAICACSVGMSQAALVVDITGVSGSGSTTWTFSGSSTVTAGSGFFQVGNNITSADAWEGLPDYTASLNDVEVLVGLGATLTIEGATRNIDLVYVDDDGIGGSLDDFAVGVDGVGNFTFTLDDVISWTGSITVLGVDIDDLSENGIPTSLTSSDYGNGAATLDLQVNIGAVPEPSSALLASAGLGLLAFRRKRRA